MPISENDDKKLKCNDCGALVDELHRVNSGDELCQSCIDDHYFFCEINEEYYPNDDCVTVYYYNRNGRKTECTAYSGASGIVQTHDGEYWKEEDTFTAHNSRNREITISREDYENGDYFTCDDCGEMYHCDYSNYVESREITVCNGCYESDEYHENDCDSIHSYSYKPLPKFKGKSSVKNPFIGFELELETDGGNKDNAEIVGNLFSENDLYLKEDSSLDDGFEIVSHPMTLEEHNKNDYAKMLKQLSKNGCKSHDTKTCGLHFHLDKSKMTDNHKVRFGAFFALTKNFMEIMARRSSERYAAFKEIKMSLDSDYSHSESRYQAVNWTNSNTVEIRIFRGTLKAETFKASMELCHSVYVFTHNKNSFNGKFETESILNKFLKFLNKNKAVYPNLIKYIEQKQKNGAKISWNYFDESKQSIDSNDSDAA